MAFETKVLLTAFAKMVAKEAVISAGKTAEEALQKIYQDVKDMAECEGMTLQKFDEAVKQQQ
jgi:hypothetical protein